MIKNKVDINIVTNGNWSIYILSKNVEQQLSPSEK